ncbi:MAG: AAA family ATPase [Proteobacteria bacterium]|nr:AAA family ATPase [Pseudomonadota bacterium]
MSASASGSGVGVVVGRFLPLHRGHQLVIEVARRACERVVAVVQGGPEDGLPSALRARWIREEYPDVTVVELGAAEVQALTRATLGIAQDAAATVFASDDAQRAIATRLGARFVAVDPTRTLVPVTGDALRRNLLEHFAFVARRARPELVRRIAVVGAESTGKTTLCARLREDLGATVVPEYTRTWLDAQRGRQLDSEAIQLVARGQIAAEDALAMQATSGILVADTDLRAVLMWSRRLFEGDPPSWIAAQVNARRYDLYLLCTPDLAYIGPQDRDLPAERQRHHDELVADLGPNVVQLAGSREERYEAAADAIIALYTPGKLLAARAGLA